jgi:hypothetical protein
MTDCESLCRRSVFRAVRHDMFIEPDSTLIPNTTAREMHKHLARGGVKKGSVWFYKHFAATRRRVAAV